MLRTTQPLLIGPYSLLADIREFSGSVVEYLLPIIRYVGVRDNVFDSLQKQFSGLVLEHSYSGLPAHVVIFSESAMHALPDLQSLHADSAYIFFSQRPKHFEANYVIALRRLVSLSLSDPSIDDLTWHIRAILCISDLSYRNDERVFPSMISADPKFRACLSKLIGSALSLEPCFVYCSERLLREDIDRFLFGSVPSLLQPYRIDASRIDVDAPAVR